MVGPLRFELRTFANQANVMRVSLRAGMVGRVGIEPTSLRLKAGRFAVEACDPWIGWQGQTRTGIVLVNSQTHYRCDTCQNWLGRKGSNLHFLGSEPSVLPVTLLPKMVGMGRIERPAPRSQSEWNPVILHPRMGCRLSNALSSEGPQPSAFTSKLPTRTGTGPGYRALPGFFVGDACALHVPYGCGHRNRTDYFLVMSQA